MSPLTVHAGSGLFPSAEPRRIGRALGVSVTLHVALASLILLYVGLRPAIEQTRAALEKTDLVYLPSQAPGGGGGGDQHPTPPKRTEIPQHRLAETVPVVAPPIVQPTPPLPVFSANVETNAATTLQIMGQNSVSLAGPGGPGRGPGAGPGTKGIGDGPGGVGNGPVPGGGDVTGPLLIRKIDPAYSQNGMVRRIQGSVELDAVVLANGTVGNIRVVKSLGQDLDDAAIAAARQWLFQPAKQGGRPVDVLVRLILDFRLH
jgi:TonB family protein